MTILHCFHLPPRLLNHSPLIYSYPIRSRIRNCFHNFLPPTKRVFVYTGVCSNSSPKSVHPLPLLLIRFVLTQKTLKITTTTTTMSNYPNTLMITNSYKTLLKVLSIELIKIKHSLNYKYLPCNCVLREETHYSPTSLL